MKKSTLLHYLFSGYSNSEMEIKILKETIILAEKQDKSDDANKFARKMTTDFPQFDILHQAFLRDRLNKIYGAINTIKIVLLIGFIYSIIVGLIVGSKFI